MTHLVPDDEHVERAVARRIEQPPSIEGVHLHARLPAIRRRRHVCVVGTGKILPFGQQRVVGDSAPTIVVRLGVSGCLSKAAQIPEIVQPVDLVKHADDRSLSIDSRIDVHRRVILCVEHSGHPGAPDVGAAEAVGARQIEIGVRVVPGRDRRTGRKPRVRRTNQALHADQRRRDEGSLIAVWCSGRVWRANRAGRAVPRPLVSCGFRVRPVLIGVVCRQVIPEEQPAGLGVDDVAEPGSRAAGVTLREHLDVVSRLESTRGKWKEYRLYAGVRGEKPGVCCSQVRRESVLRVTAASVVRQLDKVGRRDDSSRQILDRNRDRVAVRQRETRGRTRGCLSVAVHAAGSGGNGICRGQSHRHFSIEQLHAVDVLVELHNSGSTLRCRDVSGTKRREV